LGDDLAAEETEEALRQAGYSFDKPADMADTVAELLSRGEPVARCSGRMEFGARALCNRSILADPRNQDVVRVINQMVKKRDFWMPFAPVILRERQHEYIENEKDLRSPYMMMTFDTKENLSDMIAAVHNADLTCRAQLLEPGQNPEVEAIMAAFSKRTGRAVLLNTSFNLHGFPIVRTAADALHVFKNSGLQFMQLGEYLVRKTA
jgi:carbamoyltransferase